MATELINKLNFLEDEDQEAPPAMSTNPFDEPDDDIHPNHLNPFGDPDDGTYSSVTIWRQETSKLSLIWWMDIIRVFGLCPCCQVIMVQVFIL